MKRTKVLRTLAALMRDSTAGGPDADLEPQFYGHVCSVQLGLFLPDPADALLLHLFLVFFAAFGPSGPRLV